MDEKADVRSLLQGASRLNDMALMLHRKRHYVLAHEILNSAMLCMQLILRPEQGQLWPTKRDISLRVEYAAEHVRLVQALNCQDRPLEDQLSRISIADPIPVEFEGIEQPHIDVNSAIIVFNYGLTYLGLASLNHPSDRSILYDAAVELFHLSYSILVKLSVETEHLDFCEYILALSMKMLRQTICVNEIIGRDAGPLKSLLQNAEESFFVLHQIGKSTIAAAA